MTYGGKMESSFSRTPAVTRLALLVSAISLVVAGGFPATGVAASPDRMVFQGYSDNETGLFKVDVSGSNPQNITSINGASPALSPDGQLIAYVDDGPNDESAVFVLSTDGGTPELCAGLAHIRRRLC